MLAVTFAMARLALYDVLGFWSQDIRAVYSVRGRLRATRLCNLYEVHRAEIRGEQ